MCFVIRTVTTILIQQGKEETFFATEITENTERETEENLSNYKSQKNKGKETTGRTGKEENRIQKLTADFRFFHLRPSAFICGKMSFS